MKCKSFITLILYFSFTLNVLSLSPAFSIEFDDKNHSQELTKTKNSDPSIIEFINSITEYSFSNKINSGITKKKIACIDHVKRHYYIYVSKNYNAQTKSPLIVYLHGSIGNDLQHRDDDYFSDSPFIKVADQLGGIVLFPMADYSSAWWTKVGTENIFSQIKKIKADFNIDDNKVFLSGFSDGGSGSFYLAMTKSSTFAGFIPLCGNPTVGASRSEFQNYLCNLYNRPMYVVNTDNDKLFPNFEIKPMIELAKKSGGEIIYNIQEGYDHDFEIVNNEVNNIVSFIQHNSRNTIPSEIIWETESSYNGQFMWLKIDRINKYDTKFWHGDINATVEKQGLMLGFTPDFQYQGPGLKIQSLIDLYSFANQTGIEAGDIIYQFNGYKINDIETFANVFLNTNEGGKVKYLVERNNQKLIINSVHPGSEKELLFSRENSSAYIRAYYHDNTFLLNSSNLGGFTIYIDPKMVNIDKEIKIINNGNLVFEGRIIADKDFALEYFMQNYDREVVYINKISIDLMDETSNITNTFNFYL